MKVSVPACTPHTAMASANVQENDNASVQAADWVTFCCAQGPEILSLSPKCNECLSEPCPTLQFTLKFPAGHS